MDFFAAARKQSFFTNDSTTGSGATAGSASDGGMRGPAAPLFGPRASDDTGPPAFGEGAFTGFSSAGSGPAMAGDARPGPPPVFRFQRPSAPPAGSDGAADRPTSTSTAGFALPPARPSFFTMNAPAGPTVRPAPAVRPPPSAPAEPAPPSPLRHLIPLSPEHRRYNLDDATDAERGAAAPVADDNARAEPEASDPPPPPPVQAPPPPGPAAAQSPGRPAFGGFAAPPPSLASRPSTGAPVRNLWPSPALPPPPTSARPPNRPGTAHPGAPAPAPALDLRQPPTGEADGAVRPPPAPGGLPTPETSPMDVDRRAPSAKRPLVTDDGFPRPAAPPSQRRPTAPTPAPAPAPASIAAPKAAEAAGPSGPAAAAAAAAAAASPADPLTAALERRMQVAGSKVAHLSTTAAAGAAAAAELDQRMCSTSWFCAQRYVALTTVPPLFSAKAGTIPSEPRGAAAHAAVPRPPRAARHAAERRGPVERRRARPARYAGDPHGARGADGRCSPCLSDEDPRAFPPADALRQLTDLLTSTSPRFLQTLEEITRARQRLATLRGRALRFAEPAEKPAAPVDAAAPPASASASPPPAAPVADAASATAAA